MTVTSNHRQNRSIIQRGRRLRPAARSTWATAILIAVSALQGQPFARADQPNIIFIFSDDHASAAISAYGSRINKTPNIDRIANEGIRFDRCLVTNSICGPSRAVILTGKYSHLNGFRQNGDRFDGSQPTFPKMLQEIGYQTAIFGKWHLGTDPTGFDAWTVLPGQGHYYNPDLITPEGRIRVDGYVTDIVTDLALKWLDQDRDDDQPFLLMVQHKAPHREWNPGPDHLDQFRGGGIPEPETLFDDWSGRAAVLAEQQMTIANHMRDGWDLKLWGPETADSRAHENFFARFNESQQEAWHRAYREENEAFAAADLEGQELARWKYQRYMGDYLRCVQSVDDNVGRLLDYLDVNDLAENTIVIYSSDQGFYLGEHGWYDKRWIFEESLTTPLVARWPGVTPPGSVCEHMVSNLDFAETFLDAAGAPIPDAMQGHSLVPFLRGETPTEWRSAFYYHYYELGTHNVAAHYGVVTDRYKLVRYYKRLNDERNPEDIDQWDLMDRQVDPLEMKSFIDDPSYEPVKAELRDLLQSLRDRLDVSDP